MGRCMVDSRDSPLIPFVQLRSCLDDSLGHPLQAGFRQPAEGREVLRSGEAVTLPLECQRPRLPVKFGWLAGPGLRLHRSKVTVNWSDGSLTIVEGPGQQFLTPNGS